MHTWLPESTFAVNSVQFFKCHLEKIFELPIYVFFLYQKACFKAFNTCFLSFVKASQRYSQPEHIKIKTHWIPEIDHWKPEKREWITEIQVQELFSDNKFLMKVSYYGNGEKESFRLRFPGTIHMLRQIHVAKLCFRREWIF